MYLRVVFFNRFVFKIHPVASGLCGLSDTPEIQSHLTEKLIHNIITIVITITVVGVSRPCVICFG